MSSRRRSTCLTAEHVCRFYFLGDDDLLEILGQASNPDVIQTHLKKLFAGIHSVTLEGGAISHMNSVHQEAVPFVEPVAVTDVVEQWLGHLTAAMQRGLRQLLRAALQGPDPKRFAQQPSQVIGLCQEINFTMVCSTSSRAFGALDPFVFRAQTGCRRRQRAA